MLHTPHSPLIWHTDIMWLSVWVLYTPARTHYCHCNVRRQFSKGNKLKTAIENACECVYKIHRLTKTAYFTALKCEQKLENCTSRSGPTATAQCTLFAYIFDSCNFSGTPGLNSNINKFNVTATISYGRLCTALPIRQAKQPRNAMGNGSVKVFKKKKGFASLHYIAWNLCHVFNCKTKCYRQIFSFAKKKNVWQKKGEQVMGLLWAILTSILMALLTLNQRFKEHYSINDNLLCINNFHKRAIYIRAFESLELPKKCFPIWG